jgi:hypothetical protein
MRAWFERKTNQDGTHFCITVTTPSKASYEQNVKKEQFMPFAQAGSRVGLRRGYPHVKPAPESRKPCRPTPAGADFSAARIQFSQCFYNSGRVQEILTPRYTISP